MIHSLDAAKALYKSFTSRMGISQFLPSQILLNPCRIIVLSKKAYDAARTKNNNQQHYKSIQKHSDPLNPAKYWIFLSWESTPPRRSGGHKRANAPNDGHCANFRGNGQGAHSIGVNIRQIVRKKYAHDRRHYRRDGKRLHFHLVGLNSQRFRRIFIRADGSQIVSQACVFNAPCNEKYTAVTTIRI